MCYNACRACFGVPMAIEEQPVLHRGPEQPLSAAAHTNPALVLIQPSRGWVGLRLGELWAYRELLYFLVWRDIKVRYKQTVFGAAWAIIQPVLAMVVFTLFFGGQQGLHPGDIPYPLFSFAA